MKSIFSLAAFDTQHSEEEDYAYVLVLGSDYTQGQPGSLAHQRWARTSERHWRRSGGRCRWSVPAPATSLAGTYRASRALRRPLPSCS